MIGVKLSLVVIRTSNIERSLQFYRMLGLEFKEEKHGSGPVHFSCESNGLVFEIYPSKEAAAIDHKSSGATMLGFNVPLVDETIASLQQQSFQVITAAKDSLWGRRAVVLDPDNRAVDISELPKS